MSDGMIPLENSVSSSSVRGLQAGKSAEMIFEDIIWTDASVVRGLAHRSQSERGFLGSLVVAEVPVSSGREVYQDIESI